MTYVFDTNSFRVLGNYYPEQFPTFWETFNRAVAIGKIVSVREVRRELELQVHHTHLFDWVEGQKGIFLPPNAAEMRFVSEIFSVPHFLTLVNQKSLLEGPSLCRSVYYRKSKGYKWLCSHRRKTNAKRCKNPKRL